MEKKNKKKKMQKQHTKPFSLNESNPRFTTYIRQSSKTKT